MAQLGSCTLGRTLAAVFVLFALIACDDDSPESKGSGRDAGDKLDAAAGWVEPGFRVYLEGSDIMLETLHPESLWFYYCSDEVRISKVDGGMTTRLRDARRADGFYLDGEYVPPQEGLFCDSSYCVAFEHTQRIGRAREYVQTGTKAPPPNAIADAKEVPVVETRPVSGTLEIVLKYAKTERCDHNDHEARLELEVPEHDAGM
jgi:hypothetical protein